MKRDLFVPEVLQTSSMDCGPAALTALLRGLGVTVDYERLRDACQTTADGTSIDALEDVCDALGLSAMQELAPVADACSVIARRLPAIVVTVEGSGAPHFVVAWRVVAGWVQVMDPGRGRRWVREKDFVRDLHVHQQPFDDTSFVEWFGDTAWRAVLGERLARLGISLDERERSAREWLAIDAAARMQERLRDRYRLSSTDSSVLFESLVREELASERGVIPATLSTFAAQDGDEIACRAAVLLSVRRPREAKIGTVSGGLAGVVGAESKSPLGELLTHLSTAGRRLALYSAITVGILAALSLAEMLMLRAAFNAEALISLPQQRLVGFFIYGALVALLFVLDVALGSWVARLGLRLELALRMALLAKLPRLPDRYFRTRPMSDVAHRSQGLSEVKPLPELFAGVAKEASSLLVTVVALLLVHPRGALWTLISTVAALGVPLIGLSRRRLLEHRVQAHAGALSRLYVDVLFGLLPVRAHGGQLAVRALQDTRLGDWRRESEASVGMLAVIEGLQSVGVLLGVTGLFLHYLRVAPAQTNLLLLVFWGLRLPVQARSLAMSLQRVPGALASTQRLTALLSAREMPEGSGEARWPRSPGAGAAINMSDVSVVLSTQEVLSRFSLEVGAGERVAIVGSSGAGKSSVLSALLGLLDLASGTVAIDGASLDEYGVDRLRRETVWVDPTVQLWNQSLVENIEFGNPAGERVALDPVVRHSQLDGVADRLPKGLASDLGEGGARLSGGEGQRVRIARALQRRAARLVLLDEAFRGLDRPLRRRMSSELRAAAGAATVIEVTHDVADTTDFDRVCVVENGGLVESGTPRELMADPSSRYAALVHADRALQAEVWDAPSWRRAQVAGGHLTVSEASDA